MYCIRFDFQAVHETFMKKVENISDKNVLTSYIRAIISLVVYKVSCLKLSL